MAVAGKQGIVNRIVQEMLHGVKLTCCQQLNISLCRGP
jgi:hypothetical protein